MDLNGIERVRSSEQVYDSGDHLSADITPGDNRCIEGRRKDFRGDICKVLKFLDQIDLGTPRSSKLGPWTQINFEMTTTIAT